MTERRGSEVSSSSLSSNPSLAPPIRLSLSLTSSQNVLPSKNSVIGGVGESTLTISDSNVTESRLPNIQRIHPNLQNGKADIPLVINSALLNNLLRQAPVADDRDDIVTYTNAI